MLSLPDMIIFYSKWRESEHPPYTRCAILLYSMEYKYATERKDYADLASGNVFYSLPGYPAFPVRLASEIYQRCLAWRGEENTPCTIYDPCCGAAYHLSVIAYLHWDSVCRVICSDIDEKAVQLAERNLGLLTPAGMERRSREISTMVRLYKKASHKSALESITRMQEQVSLLSAVRPIQSHVFRANATQAASLSAGLQETAIDIVFTDIPYDQHSHWEDSQTPDPARAMLEAMFAYLSPKSIIAVASDKSQKVTHAKYKRLEKFQLGKRHVVILKPA
jgi:23S rRNA (guanine2535-N1)-methyltransferase